MRCSASYVIQLRRWVAAVVLSTVLTALLEVGNARARESEPVARGARIRVYLTVPAPRPVVGSLVSLEGDTLVMTAEPDSHKVALLLGSVRRLEISQGRETHKAIYGGLGLLAGVGVGALIGAAIYHPHRSQGFDVLDNRGFSAAGGALLGGLFGVAAGVVAGSNGSERWVPLDPATVHLTWQPSGRGASVSASIHF